MSDTEIFICGLSKNNLEPLKKNIDFILGYVNNSKYKNFKVIIVDSNSIDGSKEYLNKLKSNFNFFYLINKDNLENTTSRIEKIQICRNMCLDKILYLSKEKNKIYIPLDLDINLFSNITYEKLDNFIGYTLKGINKAIFPVSQPYYYDIFALRAKGWVNFNAQLINNRFKTFFRVGSFLFNYLFIFRYQITPQQISKKISNGKMKIFSAFGGAGIYNISDIDLIHQRYFINTKNKDWYSEHLYFNIFFKDLEIINEWKIDSPREHIYFKSLNLFQKIKYFLKTLIYDIKSIFKK